MTVLAKKIRIFFPESREESEGRGGRECNFDDAFLELSGFRGMISAQVHFMLFSTLPSLFLIEAVFLPNVLPDLQTLMPTLTRYSPARQKLHYSWSAASAQGVPHRVVREPRKRR